MLSGRLSEIDLGVILSPAGAGALVLHNEEEPDCLVVFIAAQRASGAGTAALATFRDCRQSIFGYPNDEVYSAVPDAGYGFFEVLDSDWADRLMQFNRLRFPDSAPSAGLRHYFMGCHDASGQFLARDLSVEVFNQDFTSVLDEALRRHLHRNTPPRPWPRTGRDSPRGSTPPPRRQP